MKCSYCLSDIKKGTGMMFITKAGAISYFCSNRCYKNGVVMRRKKLQKRSARQQAPAAAKAK